MDLNHLLHRHQVLLMQADGAASPATRRVHRARAEDYAGRIAQLRERLGASGAMVLPA